MHAMIRSTGVPIKRFIPLGIDVVGERVSKGVADCGSAVQAAHERDLPLLFMTDRMRHDLVMRSTKSRSKDEASADPSFATSAVSSRPGIDARSSAEQMHRFTEPACPPARENLGLAPLARRHEFRKSAQMRVTSPLDANQGQQDPLIMMGDICRMKVRSTTGSRPTHGNSRSYAANSAAAASTRIPEIVPRLQTRRNVLPPNAFRSEAERRSQANSGMTTKDEPGNRSSRAAAA